MRRDTVPPPRLAASALVLVLLAGGCVSNEVRWERPGAADSTIVRDASDCSAIAWTEAERQHPYGAGAPISGATVGSAWMEQRQRIDAQRFSAASRLDDLCMQNRGYRKVPAGAR